METCTRNQGCQRKPKFSVKKENISDTLVNSVKMLLQSRKDLCSITEALKGGKKGSFIEVTFVGLPTGSGAAHIQSLGAFHVDIPELIRSLHLCNLSDNEVILLKEAIATTKSHGPQIVFPGAVCMMTASIPNFRRDALFVLLSKYSVGIRYTVEQDCLNRLNRSTSNNEDDDTNQSVSSIEDDFVTALEHLDDEEPLSTNEKHGSEIMKNQRDAASQTQPAHCLDISGSKIIFSSVRRRSSIKSSTLMSFMGPPELSSSLKNTVTISIHDSWKPKTFTSQDKKILSPSPADSSESECSSPSPIIFLDEEGYQKSMKAKLNLPKIPVGKDGIEDSDSELSEFFDSFDRFDEPEIFPETGYESNQKPILASPPKKRKCAHEPLGTGSMNPQRFMFNRPTLSASVKKPTPRKPESPYSSICDLPDSPRPVRTSMEDTGTLFSPIRSSAFSPLGIATSMELGKDKSCSAYSDYANRVCVEMFDSVLNPEPPINLGVSKKAHVKAPKLKRKSHTKDSERKQKSKQKPAKGGIQKFATELVERSFGSAFKDLQKGVTSCTSAICHLAARLTSYVFQMAFYEIGRRQAFSIKERAINGLANLMVSEVISSALKELHCIKKQMVANAVTRFAADLAEELVFEGIMEVCQFSHPPTPTVAPSQSFHYEDVVVRSYAKDLSESVIQEAFIELSQVNVAFTSQAAISVSVDNLKYVSSEDLMRSTQTLVTFPNLPDSTQGPLTTENETKQDYTVKYALYFTSGLVSSVPVPVAAKALSQPQISNDFFSVSENTDISGSDGECVNNVESSDKTMLPASKYVVNNSQQDVKFTHKGGDSVGIKAFSTTMVDMIVNEAYNTITPSKVTKTVEDYAELLSKKVFEIPSQQHLFNSEASKNCFADDMAKCILEYSATANTQSSRLKTASNLILIDPRSGFTQDTERLKYSPVSTEEGLMTFMCTTPSEYTPDYPILGVDDKYTSSATCSLNQIHSEEIGSKINIQNSDISASSAFGLQSCFSHINTLSSVICSCGDDTLKDDKRCQKDANITVFPGTPPPTPLSSYNISPERSMKKLSKKLKGHLAKEFYPATPPSTPHLSAFEHDCSKKDDFMLRLMRSLSEEVESVSSDESSEDLTEEFAVSEETCQYADYLSTNIISVATEMAAYSLDDENDQGAAFRNRSLLSVLSDKWGYPAYMRNISEETLHTLCSYAGSVAGEVLDHAKKVVGKKQKTTKRKMNYGTDCNNSKKQAKDCRQIERGYYSMHFKASDFSTLSLPPSNELAGLTSKYPSCESVTEEYADHIIRVLKMEGGNSELIMDQYASRLAYRAIKGGLQQASKSIKLQCNRRKHSKVNSDASTTQNILTLLSRDHHQVKDKLHTSSIVCHSHSEEPTLHGKVIRKPEFTGLMHFAESLAHTITCDVRRKLKMTAASLPKSLTDSCLYTKSKANNVSSGDLVKTSFPKTLLPYPHKHKLYHSTGSLNENGLSEGIIQAIEKYACRIVENTLEFSLEAAKRQAMENRKITDKDACSGKLVHSYGASCRLCSVTEQPGNPTSSCHFLLGHDVSRKIKQSSKSRHNACQKSKLLHLNIPKIHIDLDKRAIFAEKIVSAALEKAERELSNTSLAADSGIGQDGMSFADSITTDIIMAAMKNIGHVVNVSSNDKDGFQSAESVTSQKTSTSVGEDSTGSWSNLSFEDEHQDESSSFLHLSDSNCNSSSWSSLGLEGDMYEENISFPPSDSDGNEEKDEGPKDPAEDVGQHCKSLLIRNIDTGVCAGESQLRMVLQWIVASESGISELCFPEAAKKELLALSRRLRDKEWKVCDLLQAVLQYCECVENAPTLHKPLFGWLLEHI
ncbi:A-kinase anchor protein 11 [Spea bombifrons]|uniref:A-kinase anchor protein 11 n=1 Tax=Spea bombifrons TaxID=233779 RepID=UPI00234BDA16|nr:A-kinase anchor protein 11 [Spea bombifrons]XP_053311426.1 A-kinase anchor protein 11 [Spea bombifrons]XP_053311427.1 A-kinase anchor protein 11 [Spea bombifrons]